ncbi:hypothetical protein PENTCL1PPCAC_10225, partial [Pristionchus entomophagus]
HERFSREPLCIRKKAAVMLALETYDSLTAAATDPEKRKKIQQQMGIMLHAYQCPPLHCATPFCATVKELMPHMMVCNAGRDCMFAHCSSCRQMIHHWNNCRLSHCRVCTPLKNATNKDAFAATPIRAIVQQPAQPQPSNSTAVLAASTSDNEKVLAALDKLASNQERTNELLARILARLGG